VVGLTLRLVRSQRTSICINLSVELSFDSEAVATLGASDELVNDLLEIITVFSARLYGSRCRKNKKLLEQLPEAAMNV
jgi:predicted site-specific integrase-resolvase